VVMNRRRRGKSIKHEANHPQPGLQREVLQKKGRLWAEGGRERQRVGLGIVKMPGSDHQPSRDVKLGERRTEILKRETGPGPQNAHELE